MIVAAFILTLLAFVQFAMAINSHFQQVYGRNTWPDSRRYLFQAIAGVYLLAALSICIEFWKLSIGILVWIGLMQTAGVLVAALITWRPAWFSALWRYACLARLAVAKGREEGAAQQ